MQLHLTYFCICVLLFSVGGRRFARGGRNRPLMKRKNCNCQGETKKENNVDERKSEFKHIFQCLLKKMMKHSWQKTMANDTFDNRYNPYSPI